MSGYTIKIINPCEIENWNNEILRMNNYSFFHSSEWSQVLSDTYYYKPKYFCLFRNGELSAVVPAMVIKSKLTGSRIVSLPFSDVCEPLFSSIDDLENVKEFIFNYCDNNELRYMEFRTSELKFPFETENFRTDLRHFLDIAADENKLYKLLSENSRRNIKSAGKDGLTIKELNSFEAVKIFYRLQCFTRRKHGLPPQPESFFTNIYKYIISKGKGDILIAYLNNIPVAALMFFRIGTKVLYKFGASSDSNLPKGANHLLMWEAIKKYSSLGYKEFDFGRTETNHEGLRRFKLGFGADERIIYTTRYDIANKTFVSAETKTTGIHNKIFKHTPLLLLKFIGNTIYKHMG
ncbi:GNAT family N-acetyltransferase [Ignavibacterium sp.]|uniref:lipid II:glycine glycyltransferase FemX n=1 Tax=Ignavibacterium sp. TaxID=2651167 RepID=UPI0025BA4880|nr:GNAT family N-acetyltransferase [Ignavibacterium sp.]